jgi:hypothetical protein
MDERRRAATETAVNPADRLSPARRPSDAAGGKIEQGRSRLISGAAPGRAPAKASARAGAGVLRIGRLNLAAHVLSLRRA